MSAGQILRSSASSPFERNKTVTAITTGLGALSEREVMHHDRAKLPPQRSSAAATRQEDYEQSADFSTAQVQSILGETPTIGHRLNRSRALLAFPVRLAAVA